MYTIREAFVAAAISGKLPDAVAIAILHGKNPHQDKKTPTEKKEKS